MTESCVNVLAPASRVFQFFPTRRVLLYCTLLLEDGKAKNHSSK